MESFVTSQSTVYLLEITHEHILDDGRSKVSCHQEAWMDEKQAEIQLIKQVQETLERLVSASTEQEEWDGLKLELNRVNGLLMAQMDHLGEFEMNRFTYTIKPLAVQDDYEF